MTQVTLRSTQHFTNHPQPKRSALVVLQHSSACRVVCGIVHLIPGRVRIRVPRLICDAELAQRLPALLLKHSQVLCVRLRRAAASVVIYYQASTSGVTMKRYRTCSRLFQSTLTTEISDFIRIIQAANEPASAAMPQLEPISILKEPLPQAPVRLKLPSAPSIVRACSLEVRQVVVPPEHCGLFHSKTGHTLRGKALAARIRKLYQHGVLYLPTGME